MPGLAKNWLWPWGVFALFGVSVTVCTTTVLLATSDSTVAVEEDYYAKAVAWDEIAAELKASEALGWSFDARFETVAGKVPGDAPLRVRLEIRDRQGAPISDAAVRSLVFHHADRGEAAEVEATPAADNDAYMIELPGTDRGLWQLRIRAERGEDLFVARVDLDTELP